MEKHELPQIPGNLLKLNISEVFVPKEISSLYDYDSRKLEIDTLKTSIHEFGQIEPITLVKLNGQYLIINGVLRYHAMVCLKKNEIEAKVLDVDTDAKDFSLSDLIVHTQIQKVKTAREKMREFISILRLDTGDSNPLRDRNKRYEFLTNLLGKGWSRSNVIQMMNVINWTSKHGDDLNLVEQVFGERIRVSEAAYSIEALSREDYGYEKEKDACILEKYLLGQIKKEKVDYYINQFNIKSKDHPTQIQTYPIKTNDYEIIHGSIEEVDLPESMELDVVFTSPIYYKLRRYGEDPNEMGWEETPQKYAERLANSLMKPFAKLKESGNMFVNLGESYEEGRCQAVIEHVVVEMVKRGMFYVDRIIWKKDDNKPNSNLNKRFLPNYEVILHFAKSSNYFFNRFKIKKDGKKGKLSKGCKDHGSNEVNYYVPNFYKQLRTILSENELHDIVSVQCKTARIKNIDGEEAHPATFSLMLPAIFLSTFCPMPTNDYKPLVFDPFNGISSTGRTALMMGLRFCGVELYEKNVNISKRILAESLNEFEPRAIKDLETFKEYELVA